ncbi:MAG: AAA family ATPase [Spirochaetia bacterium]|jgi:exonuclease SbcC
MIVRRLRVHPFGCFDDREVVFAPGLNVILGPNEAGKSTLFNAVKSSFLRTKLTKPKFAQFIEKFLPAGGGDIVRLEIEFTAADATWVLRRRWGQAPASELTGQGSGTMGDDDAIAQKLEALLPAKQGTFWKVLMTGQTELAATLDSLRKEGREALADLTDMLRRAVLATGGVPVDRFLDLLGVRRDEAFSRWDRARAGPEGNHGIENPWKNKIGTILQAWYEKETITRSGKSAEAYESGLDEINGRLRGTAAELAARESFVSGNETAARDARERRILEAELKAVRQEMDALRKASLEWPVAAHKARELEKSLAEAEAARGPLEEELLAAQRAEDTRGLRDKLARVLKKETQVEQARAKLAALPRLDKTALEEIRGASTLLERLQTGMEAGRLAVTVVGRTGVELVVQEDFDPESRKKLGPGETARLRAAGRVRIVHPDMEIEVRSGDVDSLVRAEKAGVARRALEALFARHGVSGTAEAETRSRAYEACAAEAESSEKNLAEELAGDSLAEIKRRVAALGPAAVTRPLATIASALATLKAQSGARSGELAEIRRRMEDWASDYGTPEKLLDRLAGAKNRESGLVDKLSRSSPLPEGFSDAESFLRAFESAQKKLADLRVELKGLEGDKNALAARAPDQSAEELAGQVKEAEETFRRELRRGEALERIDAVARGLIGEGASSIYDGMRSELEKLIAAMTGGRHLWVEMDGSLPRALADGKGARIGWDLLSAGTKDTLALALRMAMAAYFLRGSDGFMMMDDPLVDMDPTRRKAAAQSLVSFGSARQLILFTCHPSTAELLGGNLIRL